MNDRFPGLLTVQIPAAPRQYTIRVESDCRHRLGHLLKDVISSDKSKVLLITDAIVANLYGPLVQQSIREAGYELYTYTIPEGEGSKTLAMAEKIFAFALDIGLSRQDAMVALGGGVVGDLAGFCAATYYRGVPFVQIPTTLLAQVDSSVGGKVAVNFQTVKNGIGAFYQPLAVFIDPLFLTDLPDRAFKAGLGEVVKYALIETACMGESTESESFFDWLEARADDLRPHFQEVILRCCRMKAEVVRQDETELTGVRSYLNLGHTFAHAYEEMTRYETLLHGEAVSMGLIKACRLAVRLRIFAQQDCDRFEALCARLGLVVTPPPGLEPMQLLRLMRHDKKASQGQIRLVLPTHPMGTVVLKDDIPDELLLDVLGH